MFKTYQICTYENSYKDLEKVDPNSQAMQVLVQKVQKTWQSFRKNQFKTT